MKYHIAQVNIAKMLAPLDSVQMHDFASNLERINELAENHPGFIWRLKVGNDNATTIKIFDDVFLIINMSVWKDMQTLSDFVYRSMHAEIFKRKKEWFEKMNEMHMALWHVPANHYPTVQEALARLVYLRENGETPFAFSFKKPFSASAFLSY